MLRIHTGLRKLSNENVYDLHILRMNTFHIGKPWIKISKSELLFEQYIKAPNEYKYDIEFQNDDTINRSRIFLISCNERSIV